MLPVPLQVPLVPVTVGPEFEIPVSVPSVGEEASTIPVGAVQDPEAVVQKTYWISLMAVTPTVV